MSKVLKIIGWILIGLITLVTIVWFGFLRPEPPPVSPEDRAAIHLMPLPADMKLRNGEFELAQGLEVRFRGLMTKRLNGAVERLQERLAYRTGMESLAGNRVRLLITCRGEAMDVPSPDDDESYTLKITPRSIRLNAATETGVLFGLESLLQLAEDREGTWVLPALTMNDRPRYPWRGVMIDACRHWIPPEVIIRNLDAMASLKLNVFHWHLTEYQAFRVESKIFPRLHEMGSNGQYYTQEEIRHIVEYAADRGIRVVPEFELPGHSTSWLVGYPELGSAPGPYEPDTVFGVLDPALDPTSEMVYSFLDRFFGEMTTLFPDEYIHIGGDEVKDIHWRENKKIQAFMKQNALEDSHALQAYFNRRLQKLLEGHDKKMMGWDEILHPELPKEGVVVQTWRDHSSLWEAACTGNGAVLSAGYYLDYKQPASYHYQIDPMVIRGAVNVDIDSSNWRAWDCTLKLSDLVMEGSLYLFGEGEHLRGIMEFMGGSLGFKEASLHNGHLSFSLATNFGEIRFETDLKGDSLTGNARLSMFMMDIHGHRSGGSDMEEGKTIPSFRKIEPLTDEEETRLLGGEACMWSEMVDSLTIESRIWPRAAAIAEKLWSPQELAVENLDMYRRLWKVDDLLEELGLTHRSYRKAMLLDMAGEQYFEPLNQLAEVLQEDQFYNRMSIYDPQLYTTTPLNRMVDAAPAESFVAWDFGNRADRWIETGDTLLREELIRQLKAWQNNHNRLEKAFAESERLKEVEIHSENLALLAGVGLTAIEDPLSLSPEETSIDSILIRSEETHGGCILPLPAHIQKLVTNARQNR